MIKTGVTVLELIIVIVIIGILSTMGFSQYFAMRERAVDKEATANLKLIQAAEKVYRMETLFYYPSLGNESNISTINQYLKLLLTDGPKRNWNYTVYNTGCGRATRNQVNVRYWYLNISDADGEPNYGVGCP